MVAACPKCAAKYRVDQEQIGADGVRLRCAKCQAVFRVMPPRPAAPTSPASVAPPPAAAPVDRSRLVIVADSDAESGKRCADALSSWGLETVLVHDGVEAMLSIQRMLPRVVLLDPALPKMGGLQICEMIKRNESLRDIRVILIGLAQTQPTQPGSLDASFQADQYTERSDLPDALLQILQQFGLAVSAPPAPDPPAPQAAAPSPQLPPQSVQAPPPSAPAASDGLAAEREKAERLARIIVSDIVLYNQEKFSAAISAGNVAEAMDADLEEGRALFRQRVRPELRDEQDYLVAELLRVAQEKGMQ